MPLDIDYRPVKLPPPAVQPRRAADPIVPVEQVVPDAGIAEPATPMARPALKPRSRLPWRMVLIVLAGLVPAVLGVIGWGDPRGIIGARAQSDSAALAPLSTEGVLDPRAAAAAWDRTLASVPSDAATGALPSLPSGPAARPTLPSGSGLDRARALQCLTAAIYYEAAREPDAGQRAVAQVVLNRVSHPAFPKTVCGVVYQGSERPGCQFSFACDGSFARPPMAVWWERARRVAEAALSGYVFAPVGLATHYHTSAVHPGWADTMTYLGTIGAHRFYRWSGSAGSPRAFNAVYAGGEPLAAPHPRTWVSTSADFADPLVLEKAFEAGRLAALRANPAPQGLDPAIVRAGPTFGQQPLHPALAPGAEAPAQGHILAGSGAVRPEAEHQYDSAAHWIRQPGS